MMNKSELETQFLRCLTFDSDYSAKLRSRIGGFTWDQLDILGAAKVELAMRELTGDQDAGRALDALMEVAR